MYNKILTEQLNKFIRPEDITGEWAAFLQTVNETYNHYETSKENANEELRLLFENMREVFFVVDMENYKLLQISDSCIDVYGRSVDEFLENPNLWYDLVLEEDRNVIDTNYPIMNAGHPFTQEYRILHTNGEIKWLETKMKPILNEGGKLVRLYGMTADISKRKDAEIALKASEYKFRSLIENASDLITVADKDLKLVYISDSSYRITGFTVEEMLGTKSFSFAYPDEHEHVIRLLDEVLREPGSTKRIIYRTAKKDGSYFWCERLVTNLLHDPAVNGIVSNMRDVTERVEYEQAIQAANDDLKKTNMELDKFVYSVSHDLRAPLTSILGLTEYSLSLTQDAEIREPISLIIQSVHRLDGFIQDILDYSRNARVGLKLEKVDFDQLLDQVVGNLKFMSNSNNSIDIRVNIEPALDFYSDKSRLYVILNNLISNAVRYYRKDVSAPFVEINISGSDGGIVLMVKDNGTGIEEQYQEKVFEMFFRASKHSFGSGLGLYIVKETVEKLTGGIELKSEIGKGSEFVVRLPRLMDSE